MCQCRLRVLTTDGSLSTLISEPIVTTTNMKLVIISIWSVTDKSVQPRLKKFRTACTKLVEINLSLHLFVEVTNLIFKITGHSYSCVREKWRN